MSLVPGAVLAAPAAGEPVPEAVVTGPTLHHRLKGMPPRQVWVSPQFDATTPGWGFDAFATIQAGTDAVAERGSVGVGAGTYVENVVVRKPLSLIGAGIGVTILRPRPGGSAVSVQDVAGATVSGLTITAGDGTAPLLVVERCSRLIISENEISNNGPLEGGDSNAAAGAIVRESHEVHVVSNVITDNGGKGLGLEYSSGVGVANNRIKNGWPVVLWGAWSCTVENNTIDSRHPSGISLYTDSRDNIIRNNVIRSVPNDGPCTPIRLIFSPHNLVEGNTVSGGRWGIYAGYSDGTVVVNNVLSGHHDGEGIAYFHVSGGTIANNRVSALVLGSISLLGACNNNLIQGNTTSGGTRGISVFYDSTGNRVINNEVANVDHGMVIDGASGNTVCQNNVTARVRCGYDNATNHWAVDGVGNYWSDYRGADTDGDGLGETPHLIGPTGTDPSPHLAPFAIESALTPAIPVLGPPPSREQGVYIWGRETWRDGLRTLSNLEVMSGAQLVIENTTLTFRGTCEFQTIKVQAGGSLKILDSTINGGGGEWIVEKGATFEVRNSLLYAIGNWESGMSIYGGDAIIENCRIADSLIPLQPEGTGARIVGNRIANVYEGIRSSSAAGCALTDNRIVNVIRDGLEIRALSSLVVTGNTIEGVWGGPLRRTWSGTVSDVIHGNTFWSYRYSPTTAGTAPSTWDDGIGRGNYWADLLDLHPGAAADQVRAGVWDTVYEAGAQKENIDRFPLLCRADATAATLPGAPTLVAPVDGARALATEIAFTWQAVAGVAEHRLVVGRDRTFRSEIVFNRGDLTESAAVVSGLVPNTTYYWRVNGRNSECHSEWSPTRSFTTGAAGGISRP